jgi:Tfp pilus assembly protein FimT
MRERMAYIVVRDHQGNVMFKTELTDSGMIGRSPECAIRVQDTRVSREHCELRRWGDGWMARDQGSRNRTYVNGKAIKDHVLQDGDVIEVGDERITFFASKPTRARAADPVMAGLADAEAVSAKPGSGSRQGGSRDESSLFATCVMIDAIGTADESTVTGARGVIEASKPAGDAIRGPGKNRPASSWHVTAAAVAGVVTLVVAVWAYLA